MAYQYVECLGPTTGARSHCNHAARRLDGRVQVAMICGSYRCHTAWRTVHTRTRDRRRRGYPIGAIMLPAKLSTMPTRSNTTPSTGSSASRPAPCDAKRPHLFWQALAFEDRFLCSEVVSNYYLAKDRWWTLAPHPTEERPLPRR